MSKESDLKVVERSARLEERKHYSKVGGDDYDDADCRVYYARVIMI